MSEEDVYKWMTVVSAVVACLSGLATIGLVIQTGLEFSVALLVSTILMTLFTVFTGGTTVYFAQRVTGHEKVFTNAAEREVLTVQQRKDLRRARGEVVMERALIEVENERQNIVHRQLEAANDPTKPPHQTQWSDSELERQWREIEDDRKERRKGGDPPYGY
jgi:hypothetical protein